MTDTLIDLIRHGEPEGGQRYRGGGTDDPLSELGWRQMRDALGESAPWDRIITSPMVRCQHFATELAERHALPLAIEPAFREVGMGVWEGRSHAEVAESEPEAYAAFYRDPVGSRPAGAEPLDRFCARVAEAFDHLLETDAEHHVLIVCHAGVSRAIAGHVLHMEPERWYGINIDYAGISRVRSGHFGPVVDFINRHQL